MRARIERLFCAVDSFFGKRKLSSWGNGNLINGADSSCGATLIFSSRRAEVHELTSQFIADYVPGSMTEQAEKLVGSIIGSTAQGTFALVVSVLVSLFSASAYVRAFSRTANTVYGRVEGRGIIRTWALMWGLTIVLVSCR